MLHIKHYTEPVNGKRGNEYMEMTSAQCRGARGLLKITQPELAKAAGVSESTIIDFERSRREVSAEMIQAMRIALEVAGVMFTDDGGVKPRKRKPK
jgi:transcriptional regulator with XRE-family HTH domain